MHFTDQRVILGVKWRKLFYSCSVLSCFLFSGFSLLLRVWGCFHFFLYSLNLLGLMSDGKGWILRLTGRVAPVPSPRLPVTFPAAEVCVSHWVLCLQHSLPSPCFQRSEIRNAYFSSWSGWKVELRLILKLQLKVSAPAKSRRLLPLHRHETLKGLSHCFELFVHEFQLHVWVPMNRRIIPKKLSWF